MSLIVAAVNLSFVELYVAMLIDEQDGEYRKMEQCLPILSPGLVCAAIISSPERVYLVEGYLASWHGLGQHSGVVEAEDTSSGSFTC